MLVMRHCFRSTPEGDISAVSGMPYFGNYSAQPWPAFGVPDMHCLERGVRLAEASGAWFKRHADLPEPLHVIADDCQRDRQTGQAFLKGFGVGVDNTTFVVDTNPFSAAVSSDCPLPSAAEQAAAVQEQMELRPMPEPDFAHMVAKLYQVLGAGAAGDWTAKPCRADAASGDLVGGCQAASEFTERFIMQWGGGFELGWGRVPTLEVPELLALHAWYRMVSSSVPKLVAKTQASIFHRVLGELEAGKPGTTVFAGHDSQLNAMIAGLDMTWDPSPFPVNATLPSSALRFERVGDQVHVEYVFLSNVTDESGHMSVVPVTFGGNGGSNILMEDLSARVKKGSVAACSNPVTDDKAALRRQIVDEVVV